MYGWTDPNDPDARIPTPRAAGRRPGLADRPARAPVGVPLRRRAGAGRTGAVRTRCGRDLRRTFRGRGRPPRRTRPLRRPLGRCAARPAPGEPAGQRPAADQADRWPDEQAGTWQPTAEPPAARRCCGPASAGHDRPTGQWRTEPDDGPPAGPVAAEDTQAVPFRPGAEHTRRRTGRCPAEVDQAGPASGRSRAGARRPGRHRGRPGRSAAGGRTPTVATGRAAGLPRPLLIGGAAAAATLVVSLGVGALMLPDDDEPRPTRPPSSAGGHRAGSPTPSEHRRPAPRASPSPSTGAPTAEPAPSRTVKPTPRPSRTTGPVPAAPSAAPPHRSTATAAAPAGSGAAGPAGRRPGQRRAGQGRLRRAEINDKLTPAAQPHSQDQADHQR